MPNDLLRFEAVQMIANREDRTFRAPLLPFGEQGRTNLGKVTAARGKVRLPKDPAAIVGRLGHEDPDQPAASVAVQLVESDDGLMLAGKILNSDEGDRLLEDITAGTRNMVSVEVAKPVIRDGALVGGTLYAYAHVAEGAFPSARLVASDHGGDQQELVDRLTAESVKYKKRAQDAEAEVKRLSAELEQLRPKDLPVVEKLQARLDAVGSR